MTFFKLYLVFFQIGALAFGGGYAVIPLISDLVVKQEGWLSAQGLTDLVGLSQITPGPIAINAATFIGTKVAGIWGAIVGTLANVTPQFILMMTLGYFLFSRGKEIPALKKIMKGLKPAVAGLVTIASFDMIGSSLFTGPISGGIGSLSAFAAILQPAGIIGFIIGIIFYSRKKISVIQLVVLSAALGIILKISGII